MKAVCIIDTSVLVEILEIPNKSSRKGADAIGKKFKEKVDDSERFLLPITTVIETGNHIGQIGDGDLRRKTAQGFKEFLQSTLAGETPFLTGFDFDLEEFMKNVVGSFVDRATVGIGIGDCMIIEEYVRQCEIHKKTGRRVYIWSLDKHLQAHDTHPSNSPS